MAFKIETVKWKWADAVKQKSVYRDEEFVVASSKEEALESIDFLLNQPNGLTYTITVEREGKYFTYYRHSMPCYGGIVRYRDTDGEDYFFNPYFPRDIRVTFPKGNVIYIGIHRPNIKKDIEKPYYQFLLSKESPWVSAFVKKDSIIFKDNWFILTEMEKSDPTVFYSLMRLGGFANGYGAQLRNDWNPKADILLSKCLTHADPRRLAARKPIRISGGEPFSYTRPYCEHIFKTYLPHKFKEFGKLGGYPNAPYDNTYFITIMKDKFGIDINKPIANNNKEAHDALVKSWDFFKNAYKDLKEYDSKFRD